MDAPARLGLVYAEDVRRLDVTNTSSKLSHTRIKLKDRALGGLGFAADGSQNSDIFILPDVLETVNEQYACLGKDEALQSLCVGLAPEYASNDAIIH